MSQPLILVTGANGQLGKSFRELANSFPEFRFLFLSRADLPLHHFDLMRHYFDTLRPDYCVNCAAYTAVDKAETETALANQVNGEAVGVLAAVCKTHHTRLIHISTDYVFNGTAQLPYKETDPVDPINAYGKSKRMGEEQALRFNHETIIIRTAWVYSAHGHNFVKTMLRLMKEKPEINVVNDQWGAPTYAPDLADAIMQIIRQAHQQTDRWHPGIYHYSNQGKITWYEFAQAIAALADSTCIIHPIPTEQFPTPAKRPAYSLLNTSKIQQQFAIHIPEWKESLSTCIRLLSSHQNK